MSLVDNFSKESIQLADLPLWRKIVLVLCLVSVFVLGGNGYEHVRIYAVNPSVAVPEKGQVYPLRVMHGSLRYVTIQQLENFRNSEARGTLIGIPFVIAFLTLVTFRVKKN